MEAVHHFEVAPQVLLGEVIQHACIHQTLHEIGAILRQAKAGQPFVPYPLMIHVSIGQSLQGQENIMLLTAFSKNCVSLKLIHLPKMNFVP